MITEIELLSLSISLKSANIICGVSSLTSTDISDAIGASFTGKIFKLKTVHGALIGGSSLKFKDFLAIYKSAVKQII